MNFIIIKRYGLVFKRAWGNVVIKALRY